MLDGNPEHTTRVESSLSPELKDQLVEFLRTNQNVFAWSPAEMSGIDPNVVMHHLQLNKKLRLVHQRISHMFVKKQAVVEAKVQKLLEAGFIREEKYPTWLANVVLVRKANGKWRICVDYTDLNKACPKDCFPLPGIDQLVDSTSAMNY